MSPSGLLVVPVLLSFAACQPVFRGTGTDPDGPACQASLAQGGVVHVDVAYAPDGMPSASPDTCKVASGTRIVFRTPPGEARTFSIEFSGPPPGARAAGRLPSVARGSQRVVELLADGAPGSYKYDIHANGRTLDPVIIIDR
ncbi:hypothetical protein FKV25_02180 [Lysobacter aestuarii]|uniref:Uncharacterized protein n=2 Tax=Marilutibacter aestuarii TaxID=1706195 RepID=A0A508ALT7_9GAMM|nr:hypothetical protein FKV25_02180 [Lysobacter aestuarii]